MSKSEKPSIGGLLAEAFTSLFKKNPPLLQTEVVYQKLELPTGKSMAYVAAGILLALLTFTLAVYATGVSWIAYMLFTASLPALFFIWAVLTDRYEPEPKYLLLMAFGLGMLCGYIEDTMLMNIPLGTLMPIARGVLDPIFMFMPLYFIAASSVTGREFNDHMDGIVYGMAVSLGFITVFNYGLASLAASLSGLFELGAPFAAALLLNTALAFIGAIMGRWLGWVKVKVAGLGIAVALPGLITAIVLRLIYGAAGMVEASVGGVNVVQLILAVLLGLCVYKYSREALRDEVLWGYARGLAPVERG